MNTGSPIQGNGSGDEDRLLLAEAVHRSANEAASALAALHLIGAARGARSKRIMLKAAIERIEGFGKINRLLCQSFSAEQDVGSALDHLANAIVAGRMIRGDGRLVLDVPETWVDGGTARRALLIGYELINNAMTHVLEVHGGQLTVSVRRIGADLLLDVGDDGPGIGAGASTSGTGLGSRIVAQLVGRGGGRLECLTTGNGTVFRVVLPLARARTGPLPR
jgi:two-component sensor histidine kinase